MLESGNRYLLATSGCEYCGFWCLLSLDFMGEQNRCKNSEMGEYAKSYRSLVCSSTALFLQADINSPISVSIATCSLDRRLVMPKGRFVKG